MLVGGGCVERELAIDTEPQAALVYLNGQEVGRTPMRQSFLWYGTYDVEIRREGYNTVKTDAPVIAPWWQWVPFDFVAEILPFHLKDTHKLHYALTPASDEAVDPDALAQRGEQMRHELQSGQKPPKTRPATKPSKKARKPVPAPAPALAPTTAPAAPTTTP